MKGNVDIDANSGGYVIRSATRKSPEVLMRSAVIQDAHDRFFQSAFLKLTRNLKRAPGGRRAWIFYQASHGTYKPWRSLTEPMNLAMQEGASEEDVMAIVHCLYGLVRAHYAKVEPEVATITEALRLSIHAETREVAIHADALADPSDTNIERVLEATAADDRADATLLTICRQRLATHLLRVRAVRMQLTN